jgi:hypothetical protein
MKTFLRLFLLLALIVCSVSCGKNSVFGNGRNSNVVEIGSDDGVIRVGESTVIRVDFEYSFNEVFDDGENVIVLVRLGAELRLREGTSEIQGNFGDESVGAQVTNCDTGEQYLLFDLDDNDLSGAEDPFGEGDAELSFTVDAVVENPNAVIDALATNNSVFFECGGTFRGEEVTVVTVLPALS